MISLPELVAVGGSRAGFRYVKCDIRCGLERELNLRFRLVQTHRKYQEKASDHQFLRQLGEFSRTESTCEEALE